MPRKYKNKRKGKKKVYVDMKKLQDQKINTIWEERMVQIAQDQQKSYVNRMWLTDAPNGLRNTVPDLGIRGENYSWHGYTYITATPYVCEYIDVIKASDINQPINQTDAQNPDAAGATRGMVTASQHGFRSGNSVKIKGISLDMRIISDFGLELLHNTDNNTALEIIARAYAITKGNIYLEYKVVLVSVSNTNQALPSGDEVAVLALTYNNWGYSPVLDIEEKSENRTYKYKTLMSGRINCSPSVSFSKIGHDVAPVPLVDHDPTCNIIPYFRELKQYKEFNPPIRIDYDPADQLGKSKTRQAIYFIAKSNFDATNMDPIQRSACPRIACISKAYYYNE